MRPVDAFTFCPRCAAALLKRDPYLLVCSSCNHHFYINPLPTNAVIITNAKQEILLVKRKYPPMVGYWDLPGGFMHPFETIEESVQREVREELGVLVSVERIVGVYDDTYLFRGIKNGTISIVVTAILLSDAPFIAADDISGFEFFPKHMVLQQKIGFKSMRQAIKDYINQTDSVRRLIAS